jgi:dodecin
MDHVYKSTEITGSSSDSLEQAVHNAVAKTGQSVRNMRWFEVTDIRGNIAGDRVAQWQVTVKIGFTVE